MAFKIHTNLSRWVRWISNMLNFRVGWFVQLHTNVLRLVPCMNDIELSRWVPCTITCWTFALGVLHNYIRMFRVGSHAQFSMHNYMPTTAELLPWVPWTIDMQTLAYSAVHNCIRSKTSRYVFDHTIFKTKYHWNNFWIM